MNPWIGWERRNTLLAEFSIYLATAVALVQRYSREINAFDPTAVRFTTHQQIISGDAVDPYRFRVLIPEMTQWLWEKGPFGGDPAWLDRIHFALFGICFVAMFWLIRVMLTELGWSPGQSLVGPLLLALALPVAFTFHDYQPWSWLEAVFIPLVYILALRKSPIWILLLVAIAASLNRETAVALSLIPIALSVRNWNVSDLRRYYLYCSAALIIPWMVIRFYMLTVWPGPANQRAISIQEIWERNFDFSGAASLQWGGWLTTIFTLATFAGGILVAAIAGLARRKCPTDALWIAVFTLPVFFAGWFVFAVWSEVRVLLPVLIIALPLTLSAFATPACRKHDSQ